VQWLGPIKDLRLDPTWPAARAAFINQLPPNPTCGFCQQPILGAVTVDHDPPYAISGNHDGLRPAHRWCNSSAGGKLGNQRRRLREVLAGGDEIGPRPLAIDTGGRVATDPAGSDRWQVPWLADLLEVPADATWPRFMSAPHPRAVGSLGLEVEEFELARTGKELRWWQRLWLRRQLEIDSEGQLVWAEILTTVARQVGKSYGTRALMVWRRETGTERFGDSQLVLHVSKSEAQAQEIQRPYMLQAMLQPALYKVTRQNGNHAVEHLASGGRWLIKAMSAVYGYSADLSVVDEAWSASPSTINDGLVPVMLERAQAQLLLISTAHRAATGLVLDRRAGAIAELDNPADVLLLEWSAHPDREDDDPLGWREASPHWSEHRGRLIQRKLDQARRGESVDPSEPDPMVSFRTQYLNQWPSSQLRVKRGQPLLPAGLWVSLATSDAKEDPASALVMAVEDTRGDHAAAVGAVTTTDGRLAVWGKEFAGRAAALEYAMAAVAEYDGRAQLLVGASMAGDPMLRRCTVRVELAGSKEFRTGLPLLRSLISAGRLVHDGAPGLSGQLDSVRVLEGQNGLSLVGGQQADLLRALVWSVQQSTVKPWVVPSVY